MENLNENMDDLGVAIFMESPQHDLICLLVGSRVMLVFLKANAEKTVDEFLDPASHRGWKRGFHSK